MLTRLILLFSFLTALCVFPGTWAQADEKQERKPSIAEYRAIGLKALERKDNVGASDAADRLLEDYENDPRAMRSGSGHLSAFRQDSLVDQAVRAILAVVPNDKPELWQYGIALAWSAVTTKAVSYLSCTES